MIRYALLLSIGLLSTPASWADSLQLYRGQYFQISRPQNWGVTENANGIEAAAPDGSSGYSFALLIGAFGQMTPQDFLTLTLQSGPYQNPQILDAHPLPDQPGPMGLLWKVIEVDLQYGYLGRPVRAHTICAVIQGAGQYTAVVRAYQAPVGSWEQQRGLLAAIDESLAITNPGQLGGIDKVQLPKGVRHDEIYGSYNRGVEQRQRESDARLSQQRHESTMEYERMQDPSTGQYFDMPMSEYDPTVGGYRNPNDPTQLLIHAAPGE